MTFQNLDLDTLRTLVVASDLGRYSRAAKRLGRTPSAISLQMRRLTRFPLTALALIGTVPSLSAQTTGNGNPCVRHDYDDTTPPCVIGRVVDAATKRPIVGAEVTDRKNYGTFARTDSTGAFAVFANADETSLSASRNDYAAVTSHVDLHDARTTMVNFALRRLPAPCCRLAGQWEVTLTLGRRQPGVTPTARIIRGKMVFGRKIPSPLPGFVDPPDDTVRMESGRFDINLTPFLGAQVPEQVSTTVTPNGEASFLRDVVGTVFPGDTVELTLIPNLSHGSIVVRGKIAADSIAGTWSEQAYAAAAAGRLRMHRYSRTAPELHEPPPPPSTPPVDRSTWGKARIRVWEASRNHYIIVSHSLEFPDGMSQSAYHTHASSEGWGDTIELPPGDYEIGILDFPHGDRSWRVPPKSTRRFTVVPGQTTDVTIRLNLATGAVLDSAGVR